MKLHESVVNKILRIYEMWGGRRDNIKLKNAISGMDLTEYKQKLGGDQTFLVLTEDTKPKPR